MMIGLWKINKNRNKEEITEKYRKKCDD